MKDSLLFSPSAKLSRFVCPCLLYISCFVEITLRLGLLLAVWVLPPPPGHHFSPRSSSDADSDSSTGQKRSEGLHVEFIRCSGGNLQRHSPDQTTWPLIQFSVSLLEPRYPGTPEPWKPGTPYYTLPPFGAIIQ